MVTDKLILRTLMNGPKHTSEVAAELEMNSSTARDHLHALESKGKVNSSNDPVHLTYCVRVKRLVFGPMLEQCKKKRHPLTSFNAKRFLWSLTARGRRSWRGH